MSSMGSGVASLSVGGSASVGVGIVGGGDNGAWGSSASCLITKGESRIPPNGMFDGIGQTSSPFSEAQVGRGTLRFG